MKRFRPIAFALLLFFGCRNEKAAETPPAPPKPTPVYYFYPKANVYFDSANKDYLFLTGDSNTWTTQRQIPAALQSMLDKNVLIEKPAEPVWRDNVAHKLVYGALLYASPTDTVEQKPVPAVVKTERSERREQKRGGIRRFFDKIFGKKKKD